MIISSLTDIRTYVVNENPGGVYGHDDLTDALVEAIRDADHPAYGRDWSRWLDDEIDGLVVSAVYGEGAGEEGARMTDYGSAEWLGTMARWSDSAARAGDTETMLIAEIAQGQDVSLDDYAQALDPRAKGLLESVLASESPRLTACHIAEAWVPAPVQS